MSNTAVIDQIESLTLTVKRLESRVEELEARDDLRDLETAIAENAGQPLVEWEKAKSLLDLD